MDGIFTHPFFVFLLIPILYKESTLFTLNLEDWGPDKPSLSAQAPPVHLHNPPSLVPNPVN